MEYLYSQTGAVLQQDLGRDPDAPDGTEEEWEEEEEDEDEGFQEELADMRFADNLSSLLQSAQPLPQLAAPAATPSPALSSQSGPAEPEPMEEEEDDVRGPDGHGGYHHAVRLAHALVELRHHAYVTQRQVREIAALWQRLSDRDKAGVSFPPCHQERLVKGRFKAGPSKHAHTPGVDSVTRHNERSKAQMTQMVRVGVPGPSAEQTAAEPLPTAKALLKEPVQPDQPLTFPLPADASGQAVTHRGPLAPELFNIIATTPPSSSTSGAPPAATSAAATSAAATSTAATSPSVPRSTAWQRKLREEQQRRAQEEGALFKPARKNFEHFMCKRCGQPKTKQYGHSRYRGEHFCSQAEGRSVEDWLAEKRSQDPKKQAEAVQQLAIPPLIQPVPTPVPRSAPRPRPSPQPAPRPSRLAASEKVQGRNL